MSSFSSPDFMILQQTFGKKYFVLGELVLYEYHSDSYFKAHPEQPLQIYNLAEYQITADEKGILVNPKNPKGSIKGTLMETKDMTVVCNWLNCIEHNNKRRDYYYLDIIRSQKKIILNNHLNNDYNMQNIVEQDLKTNQSANNTMIYDQSKQFKNLEESFLKKVTNQFIDVLEKTVSKQQNNEMRMIKELLQSTNSNYIIHKDQEFVKNLENILKLFNHQMVDQFYKRDNIRNLIKKKIFYSNYSFILYQFIAKFQNVILYEISINNIQSTKELLCYQEKLIRNSINDLELVVKTLLEDYNSAYQIAIPDEVKYTLNKVFKFFQNEIECLLCYINFFITELINNIYSSNQINYLLQSLKNPQMVQYIGLGQVTIEILEVARNQNQKENTQKIEQILNKLCNSLYIFQNQITDKINRINSTTNNYSAIGNILES